MKNKINPCQLTTPKGVLAATPTAELKAVSAIIKDGAKYLLIQRGNHPSKGLYAFPGGMVKANEPIEHGVIRELEEETGLNGHSPLFLCEYCINSGQSKFKLYVFRLCVDHPQKAVANGDALTLGWFTISEALSLPLAPNMADCLNTLSS